MFITCIEYIYKYPETFYVLLEKSIKQHKYIQRNFVTGLDLFYLRTVAKEINKLNKIEEK